MSDNPRRRDQIPWSYTSDTSSVVPRRTVVPRPTFGRPVSTEFWGLKGLGYNPFFVALALAPLTS